MKDNNTHSTVYLWVYCVRYVVKDLLDSNRGNPLLPLHGLLFQISSKGSCLLLISWSSFLLYAPSQEDRKYHSLCYTSHGALAGTRNISIHLATGIDPKTHSTISNTQPLSYISFKNIIFVYMYVLLCWSKN